MARALSFIVANSLILGALCGLVALGAKHMLEPSLGAYLGPLAMLAVIFVYGRWIWTPLWRLGVSRRWA
jgi:EamA domain-containing membrane protein RarD